MKNSAAGLLLVVLAIACGSAPATNANRTATLAALATQPPSPTQFVATPTASPTARAVATAVVAVDPLAIGDPCLVGRWTLTNLMISDSVSFRGITMSMTGELGTVSQPDFNSEAPPFAGSYTCAGSNLTMAIDLPNYSQTATFKK
jgi:hypothetical protein